MAFLDRSLRQSVRNATEEMQNWRSANRSETLASFRWAVGDPGTPWKEPWRVPGWTLRVQGAIPGRQKSYEADWVTYFGSPKSSGGGKGGVNPPLVINSH